MGYIAQLSVSVFSCQTLINWAWVHSELVDKVTCEQMVVGSNIVVTHAMLFLYIFELLDATFFILILFI